MKVLETIVRLPAPPIPGQPVCHLRVRTLTIPYFARHGIAMAHIGELCYELRALLQPHQMARRDPFAKAAGTSGIRGYEVPVHRKSRLQSVGAHGAGEDIGYDGAVAVHVARIGVTAEQQDGLPAIAHSEVVVQSGSARRHRALCKQSHKMYR